MRRLALIPLAASLALPSSSWADSPLQFRSLNDGSVAAGNMVLGRRVGTQFVSTPARQIIPGVADNPVAFINSRLGECDQLAGKFLSYWPTNNYLPDCDGFFFGEGIPYAATRGARSVANSNPKQLDRSDPERTRILLQHKAKGTFDEGVFVVNAQVTAGGGATAAQDRATTLFGMSAFVGKGENGSKPGKFWFENFDAWFGPSSGRHLAVYTEKDINYHNEDCGYDAESQEGCYLVNHWDQYNSAQAWGFNWVVSPIQGPALFGHVTINGTAVTAIDWEQTIGGLDGPFTKGTSHLWLYAGSGVQVGFGSYYRVASVTDTKHLILEKAPGNGTWGFQLNPPQLRTGMLIHTGGTVEDSTNKDRQIHGNLIKETNFTLNDFALTAIKVGGWQKYALDTSSAQAMDFIVKGAPGQKACFSFEGGCFYGDTNPGSPYVIAPPLAWVGTQAASPLDFTIATAPGGIIANLNNWQIIKGGLSRPQAVTRAALLATPCDADLIGARATVTDIQGTPTWGQPYSALTGGGAGSAALPAFCDGGIQGWVAR